MKRAMWADFMPGLTLCSETTARLGPTIKAVLMWLISRTWAIKRSRLVNSHSLHICLLQSDQLLPGKQVERVQGNAKRFPPVLRRECFHLGKGTLQGFGYNLSAASPFVPEANSVTIHFKHVLMKRSS